MFERVSRDEIMSALDEKVNKYISISGNCAQTAFLALSEQFDLKGGAVLQALTAFVGGIALRGETCGVVVGCVMAFGMAFGKEEMSDMTGYFNVVPKARTFCERFETEAGGMTCRQIAKADFHRWYASQDSAHLNRWREYRDIDHRAAMVRRGVRIAADIILGETEQLG